MLALATTVVSLSTEPLKLAFLYLRFHFYPPHPFNPPLPKLFLQISCLRERICKNPHTHPSAARGQQCSLLKGLSCEPRARGCKSARTHTHTGVIPWPCIFISCTCAGTDGCSCSALAIYGSTHCSHCPQLRTHLNWNLSMCTGARCGPKRLPCNRAIDGRMMG